MTRGDNGEQDDRMSEGFHSTGSGGGEPQSFPAATHSEGTTEEGRRAPHGDPSAITTNPARPDLADPDMSTPEGLAMARGILQRALDITSRHADRASERAWSDARPRSAPAAASTTAVHGDSSERGSAPGNGSDVLRIAFPSAAETSAPYAGQGAVTFGLGGAGASQLPSVPTWTTTPAYGSTTQAPASWPTPRMRTAIAAYGGYALQDVATPSDPKSAVSSTPAQPPVTNAPTPATGTAAAYRFSGMPSHIKNAVRMIQPFYSENSTVDKARAFWEAFERATVGLDESLRLSAFRECLKGKPGEEWWMYSRIEDFETLRVRFHNQFICLSPLQMIERLKNTKR
ncbi:hypothetical protein PR003_g5458 [Phytophthora rubi]|uniref:Uncharacterized protein n=2 Tax=Phytophthora rubi TaxID=129364 RepID=A0A6A4FTF3_9STRA|nr:hypothetical protein PR003_g5458 [Phytophthora rubi]